MNLTRGEGEALWRQIARTIEDEIATGTLKPGDRLPTEALLSGRFDVNRHTVRRALAHLAERGLVRAEQGRGTFVEEAVVDYRIGRRTRISETLRAQHRDPAATLLRSAVVSANPRIAEPLGLPPGARVTLLETLSRADGRPISVTEHWFPTARFHDMVAAFVATGSITRAMEAHGVSDYFRKHNRVIARPADAEEARLLELPRNRPVLVTESINVDAHGAPVEFGIARFAADRVHLVFEP